MKKILILIILYAIASSTISYAATSGNASQSNSKSNTSTDGDGYTHTTIKNKDGTQTITTVNTNDIVSNPITTTIPNTNPVHQIATDKGVNIEAQATGDNAYRGTFQNGVDDPVNFTATSNGGRTEIVTEGGQTITCESGLCVGPGSDAFQDVIDSISTNTNLSQPQTTPSKAPTETTIFTSEMVPGATCWCVDNKNVRQDSAGKLCSNDIEVPKRKYQCTLPTGLAGFQSILAQIIRWVINIVLLLGVLAVVGLGIAWSFAGGDDIKAKSTLKKWAINIIIGLIILFFFKYILAFLAPWVYQ